MNENGICRVQQHKKKKEYSARAVIKELFQIHTKKTRGNFTTVYYKTSNNQGEQLLKVLKELWVVLDTSSLIQ